MRRQPDSATPSTPVPVQDESQTGIIRRHPTGELPAMPEGELQTSYIEPASLQATGYIPRPRPTAIPKQGGDADPRTAVAAAVVSIVSGWATAVIATDLITGWWRTDRLFCVAVGFLSAITAAAIIGGLVQLLLRRRMGRLLIVVGSVISLLIFASLFVAGAKLPPAVYAIPVLPLAGIALTMLPSTARWSRSSPAGDSAPTA
ncbi:hypothetical protein Q2100_18890 [Mycolicibacterium sp. KC 300]|uniref:Uncharacterized protein n=1 Tax=Mycolicibacterium arseniciresistens TaxID=3062257 RepID=A0ABT8UJ31_9MYCO|nr:hypothetical protein [Mycolicibacterium arseniciresistens]MDO3637809.1 hypothetical protein [Mycolicibacterium arseniciresistens]